MQDESKLFLHAIFSNRPPKYYNNVFFSQIAHKSIDLAQSMKSNVGQAKVKCINNSRQRKPTKTTHAATNHELYNRLKLTKVASGHRQHRGLANTAGHPSYFPEGVLSSYDGPRKKCYFVRRPSADSSIWHIVHVSIPKRYTRRLWSAEIIYSMQLKVEVLSQPFFFERQQLFGSSLPNAKIMVIESATFSRHTYATAAGEAAA